MKEETRIPEYRALRLAGRVIKVMGYVLVTFSLLLFLMMLFVGGVSMFTVMSDMGGNGLWPSSIAFMGLVPGVAMFLYSLLLIALGELMVAIADMATNSWQTSAELRRIRKALEQAPPDTSGQP